MPYEDSPYTWLNSRTWCAANDLEVYHCVSEPFCEASDATTEVTTGFELGVNSCGDCKVGKGVAEERAEVGREVRKRFFSTLYESIRRNALRVKRKSLGSIKPGNDSDMLYLKSVDEAEKQSLLHPAW